MLIYEVNLEIKKSSAERYLSWLTSHIQEVVDLGGFISATLHSVSEKNTSEYVYISTHYRCANHQVLDTYLRTHASRLRKEVMDLFPGEFTAQRRVLQEEMHFSRTT